MGLGFLVPAFLAGLLAIGIPVIVHLLNKERKEVVRFPSLMFFERIPYRAIRRQTIRHPLLLALRALAVLLLVAAFARPFLERSGNAIAGLPGGREVVVLLDQSYSMGYGDRWSRALRAARNEAAGIQPGDRISLVAFDDRASVVSASSGSAAPLTAALDTLQPGNRTTHLGPALAAAREVLAGSTLPRREVVLISDLQRDAWDGGSEGRLPANVTSRIISVADSNAGNAMVALVDVDRERRDGQTLGTVVARVRNQESSGVTRRVSLEVQGRTVETRTVELPARATVPVRFAQLPIPAVALQASVQLEHDALPADDVLYFSLSRDQSLPVLVLSATPRSGRSIYVERALALGRVPPLDLTVQTVGRVKADDLDRYAVIVLNNVAFPVGALGRELLDRVRSGAGLIAIVGENSDPARWSAEAREMLPAATRGVVDRSSDRGGRLGNLERSHEIFQPFSGPRSGDFTSAKFFRYRLLEPRDSVEILAWYDDGNAALVEGSAGQGRVLLWSSTLDDFWNDLALQPVFLPFLLTSVHYAAGYVPDPAWRTVGNRVSIVAADSQAGPRAPIVVTPRGARTRLDPSAHTIELSQPGFYQVQGRADRDAVRSIAVNVDRSESDFRAWNAEELRASITSNDSLPVAAAAEALTDTQREQRQRVWWFLLLAAALLLVTEIILANRMSRAAV